MKQIVTLVVLMTLLTGCEAIGDFFGSAEDNSVIELPAQPAEDAPAIGNPPPASVGPIDGIEPSAPPALVLEDTQRTLDLGSYCWSGLCADVLPPTYVDAQAEAVTSNTLTLSFAQTRPSSVTAYVHPGMTLATRIADIPIDATLNSSTLTLTLPESLDGTYILVVTVVWDGDNGGDAFYSLPISIGG